MLFKSNRIAQIKALYEDYCANYRNYIDFSNPIDDSGEYVTYRRQKLEDVLGIKCLGAGAYSKVYALDEKKVLKISNRKDAGYESFVRFIKSEGRKYAAFPKLYYSNEWAGNKVYIIERMEDINDDNYGDRQFLVDYVNNIINGWGKKSRFVNISQEFDEALKALKNWYNLSRNNNNEDIHFDIHSENIMINKKGLPVITDPFS